MFPVSVNAETSAGGRKWRDAGGRICRAESLAAPDTLPAVEARNPEYVASAILVGMAGGHEKMIGKPVDIGKCSRIDRLGILQCRHQALGPAHHGSRQMQIGGGRTAAWQHEGGQRRQPGIHGVDLGFQPVDLDLGYPQSRPAAAFLFILRR